MKKRNEKMQYHEFPTDLEIGGCLGVVFMIGLAILVFMAWIMIY